MAGNVKGITIEFRGDTTQLDKALREVRNSTKDIDSELRDVNKALKFNPTSVELWKQKQTLLNQKIDQTDANLQDLKKAQKQLDAKNVDKNSAEYRELQREIITTESKLKTFRGQLQAIGNVKLQALGQQFKQIGSKMMSAGRTMTTYVTAPIVAGFTLAANSASDYEENLNKIDVAFGKSAKEVKKWAKTARKNFGMSQVQATSAVSGFGALAKGIGLTEEASADVSTTLAGLTADLGSYFNVGTDEAAKALEGIFTGESEALKKFGVVMTDTNLKKFAEDQGLVWEEMDQTEKTMLRYNYVLAKTKDAQGDFSRTSDGTANSVKIFQSTMQDLATNIGTVLLPIITPVIQKISDIVAKIADLPKPAQTAITVIGLLAAALGPLLLVIGGVVNAIGMLLANSGMITGAFTAMLGPVGLIVAGIAALVAAFALAYKESEEFRSAVGEIGSMLVTTFTPVVKMAVSTVKQLWAVIVDTAKSVGETLAPALKTMMPVLKMVATIMAGRLKAAFTIVTVAVKLLSAAIKGIAIVFAGVVQKVASLASSIKSKFESVAKAFKSMFSGGIKAPHVPLPHFSISPKGWKIGDLLKGKIPSLNVNWYAKGGIFNSPSLIGVGEAGSEAVVPLDKLWNAIADINGGVVINVNGAGDPYAVAQEVKRVLIEETKRRRLAWQ